MIAFDAGFLIVLLDPNARISKKSGLQNDQAVSRINYLIQQLEKSNEKVIIPTPALSEFLVRIKNPTAYLDVLKKSARFIIADFNQLAAIEVALMHQQAVSKGNKRGNVDATWAKIKFDRQIVAIAKVNNVHTIYTEDGDVEKLAKKCGIKTVALGELPENPADRQGKLPLDTPKPKR